MNILILCASLFGLFVLQACFIVILLRIIKTKLYADIAQVFNDLFVSAKEGEQSKIGLMMSVVASQLADQFADTLFTKLKMSAIGQKGGSTERSTSDKGGLGSLIPLLLQRFVPGGIGGLLAGIGGPSDGSQVSHNNNHSESPKFKF